MACNHLNELAEELIECNIYIDANQLETGVWQGDINTSRIFYKLWSRWYSKWFSVCWERGKLSKDDKRK